MTTPPPVLDPSFLAIQRARLVALRTDLSSTMHRDAEEARQVLSGEFTQTCYPVRFRPASH
jgi:hypothetical protein